MMKKKKIMIADDDPAILEALSLIFTDEGYEVTTTVDGKTLEDIRKELPDILLLDIRMSGMDGKDICQKLKHNLHTKHIPIIMISANSDAAKIAKEAGADDFIAKPFEMTDLLKKVAKFS